MTEDIPSDVLPAILKLLKGKDLARACCVCKTWHRVLSDDRLWRSVVAKDFPMSSDKNPTGSWREAYLLRCKWRHAKISKRQYHSFSQSGITCHLVADKIACPCGILDSNTGSFVWADFGEKIMLGGRSRGKWIVSRAIKIEHGLPTHSVSLLVWDVDRDKRTYHVAPLDFCGPIDFIGDPPHTALFSSKNWLVAFDLVKKKVMRILAGHETLVTCLWYGETGEAISGCWDGSVKLWKVRDGECMLTIKDAVDAHTEPIFVKGLPDRLVIGSSNGRLDVRSRSDGSLLFIMEEGNPVHPHMVREFYDIHFAASHDLLVKASVDGIKVFDMDSGQCLRILVPPPDVLGSWEPRKPSCLAFDGKRIVCGYQKQKDVLVLGVENEKSKRFKVKFIDNSCANEIPITWWMCLGFPVCAVICAWCYIQLEGGYSHLGNFHVCQKSRECIALMAGFVFSLLWVLFFVSVLVIWSIEHLIEFAWQNSKTVGGNQDE